MQTIRAITSALAVLTVSLCGTSAQTYLYNWTTIAGLAGQPGSADGTNSAVRFRRPQGLALDYHGNLYVADADNSTIRRIRQVGTNWVTITIAGLAGSRGSADGTNNDARFNLCSGVAVNPDSGTIFVADTFNHTIRMITPSGLPWVVSTNWVVTTIAGQPGMAGSEDGTNRAARFSNPLGISVVGESVFVADTANSTVRLITKWGTNWVARTLAGLAGSFGSADGTNSAARFRWPGALAVIRPVAPLLPPAFQADVFVADTWNSTLREFDFEGEGGDIGDLFDVRTLAGRAGQIGSADGLDSAATFFNPAGIAVDINKPLLFVADGYNHTIRRLTWSDPDWVDYYPGGKTNWLASTIGGSAGHPGDTDGTNSDALFYGPQGVAVDGGGTGAPGRVFVADSLNHTIRMGVIPAEPPVIQSLVLTNGLLELTWSTASGRDYLVYYATNLTKGSWSIRGGRTATGSTANFSDVVGLGPQRFYRVVLLP